MTCNDVRAALPAFLDRQLDEAAGKHIETHLAACPACRGEHAALAELGRLLDAVPAPTVTVDLARLYRDEAEQQRRQVRRWRRLAVAAGAVAALVMLALGLRLEVRAERHQLTLRWGTAPVPVPPPAPTVTAEQVQVLSDLIHALATDVESRDRRQSEELTRLRDRLGDDERRTARRHAELERVLAAVYASQFTVARREENP